MLINILTYLKTMSKLITIPKFYGPLATVAFTVAYHLAAVYFGFSVSLAWLYLFLVAGSFIGGLRAGLLCAAWISLYAHYIGPDDWFLTIQRVTTSFATAALVGWQTQQLRKYYKAADELLNGNTARLNQALADLRLAKDELREVRLSLKDLNLGLARETIGRAIELIEKAEDGFGNVLAKVVGYTALRKMIREVNEEYGSDG